VRLFRESLLRLLWEYREGIWGARKEREEEGREEVREKGRGMGGVYWHG